LLAEDSTIGEDKRLGACAAPGLASDAAPACYIAERTADLRGDLANGGKAMTKRFGAR
jgi:hypothetical protein